MITEDIVRKVRTGQVIAPPIDPRRSALMARVKAKNSRPEMMVRKTVHAFGFRFRLHRRDLPGSPDLVFPRLKKVIFVHGCFWHRHKGCPRTTTPKTRLKFWTTKFKANTRRDAQVEAAIRAAGWRVLIIWECDTFDPKRLAHKLTTFLRSPRHHSCHRIT
jgi:DNA mismatch endonuclease, patch repair protein